jgi:preprotein translocase subunit SecD
LQTVHPRHAWRQRPLIFAAAVALMFVALTVGARYVSRPGDVLIAAVRFEVRLAEDRAAPGLVEAVVSGTDRRVYLHPEIIVANSDIARATAVEGGSNGRMIALTFTTAGAAKITQATARHIGKPIAILLDGRVVMAPTVRSPIGATATINGSFTPAELQRIVDGILGR